MDFIFKLSPWSKQLLIEELALFRFKKKVPTLLRGAFLCFWEEGKKGRRIYDLRSFSKFGDSNFHQYSTILLKS